MFTHIRSQVGSSCWFHAPVGEALERSDGYEQLGDHGFSRDGGNEDSIHYVQDAVHHGGRTWLSGEDGGHIHGAGGRAEHACTAVLLRSLLES